MNNLPQRVALASFKGPRGDEVLVYIRREWLALLDQLVQQSGITPDGELGDDLGPPDFMVRPSTKRLESDNETAHATTTGRISSLYARVSALEEAPGVYELRAQVAALRAEIQALKEAPP